VLLDDVAGTHEGGDVYVIASGKTLDYYDPRFFDDKFLIGVNYGWSLTLPKVDYMVTKYHHTALEWVSDERVGTMVVTRGLRGHRNMQPLADDRMLVVDHNENTVERWDGDWPENGLVATHSTITTAMHLAAVLGARNIVMVGADCGVLDEETNVGDYNEGHRHLQFAMFGLFEKQNRIVANILRDRYKVNVVSLLPFVTPNMEGHTFKSHAGVLNA
jgi:hypothetical protein